MVRVAISLSCLIATASFGAPRHILDYWSAAASAGGDGDVRDELIAELRFEGDWTDSEGTNDGTAYNGPLFSSAYLNRTATHGENGAYFDGGADRVELANESNFDFGATGSCTYSFWLWTFDNTSRACIGKTSSGNYNPAVQFGSGGNLQMWQYKSGTSRIAYSVAISEREWTFFVGVVNGDDQRCYTYVNGTNKTTGAVQALSSPDNNEPVQIGHYFGPSYLYYGYLDELRIYGKALSDDEVLQLYNYYLTKEAY